MCPLHVTYPVMPPSPKNPLAKSRFVVRVFLFFINSLKPFRSISPLNLFVLISGISTFFFTLPLGKASSGVGNFLLVFILNPFCEELVCNFTIDIMSYICQVGVEKLHYSHPRQCLFKIPRRQVPIPTCQPQWQDTETTLDKPTAPLIRKQPLVHAPTLLIGLQR